MFTTTTARTRTLASVGALTLASVVLAAAGTAESAGTARPGGSGDLVRQAQAYVGDPWEKRFRAQFWQTQHIHDSWNPCHIGENVPKRLQGSGPHCWDRLPGRG